MKKLIFLFAIFIVHCTLITDNCICQWQPDVRLTNNINYSAEPSIITIGSINHVVWSDDRNGNNEIYYKRSTDGGITWGTDTRLTNFTGESADPSISVSGSAVHLVWNDNRDGNWEIYYKRSTDAGLSWGSDSRLTNNTGESKNPSAAVNGITVHVVWYDIRDGNSEIYYKRSSDGGVNWGTDIRLTNNPGLSGQPNISVSGSLVHVVWYDTRDGNDEIYYKRSTDGGMNWGTDTRLTNNTDISEEPSISVSGSAVSVVWFDYRDGNAEIYYKRSTDGGMNWGTDTRLTNNIYDSYRPSISVSGSAIHVVWFDYRDGNTEIYYKRSTDGGVIWGTDTRLTDNISYSFDPSISLSGSAVHVVWMDERDGNPEIYYKRNPTINPFGAPLLLTPVHASTGIGITPTLDWQDMPAAEKYRLQVSTSTAFSSNLYDIILQNSQLQLTSPALQNGTTYYWRVSSIARQDTSAWASYFMFTTILAAPNLVYPPNGATNISVTPNMDWDPVTSATGYWIQLSTNSGFTNLVFQDTVMHPTTNLIIPNGVLNYSTTYYWRVIAIKFGEIAISSVWNFTTITLQTPPAVRLISPPNNAVNQPVTPLLDWADTTNCTNYRVQIATSGGFTTIIWDTTVLPSNAIVSPGKLSYLTNYYWRVAGINITLQGPWSAVWNFTTSNIPPPGSPPTLSTPPNNSSNAVLNTMFSWYPAGSETFYRCQVASNSGFISGSIKMDTIISAFNVTIPFGRLDYYSGYYWRVYSGNAGGYSPPSPVWYFSTLKPSAPILMSPANNSQTYQQDITFKWNAGQYISGRKFQLATDNSFTNIVQSFNNLQVDSVSINGLPLNTYYWRVCGQGALGDGPWSNIWSFTVNSIGVTNLTSGIPKEYKLYENYPNPFNPSTKIRFDIPSAAHVKLVVYDILGRKIEILADEKLNAGSYLAEFNAGKLPSGIYIYVIVTDKYTYSRRMILTK